MTSLPTRVHLAQSPCSHMDLGSLRVIIDMPVEQVSWCGRCGWAGRIDGVPLFPISYYVDTVVHSWPAGVQAQTLRKTECFVKSCPSILFLSVSIRSWQRPVLYLPNVDIYNQFAWLYSLKSWTARFKTTVHNSLGIGLDFMYILRGIYISR